jgi:amino acid adenylation domain-containing protein
MGLLLHHSIEEAAERCPDHEAFRFRGSSLTYASLAGRSNQLANFLRNRGVRSMDRVGIYMLKGLELPVALYGILKAGGAYVPIDPGAPRSRIQAILKDCDIRHLVTNDSRARQAASLAREVSTLECVVGSKVEETRCDTRFHSWSDIEAGESSDPRARITEHDLAYIMYTSGSTGVPKGLMHTHHSGMSYARLSARTYGVRSTDRLANHSPLHFDMSTFEYLTGPLCAATTVIVPEETTLFPVSLAELIERERVTFWYSVPLALIQLITQGELARFDCSCLRWVLFGGEPFPPKYLWRLMRAWPQARFSNSYGPAEVNQCTYYHVPSEDMDSPDPIPIGRVWEGAEGLIVDADDEAVAPGATGELLIRAPTMMRGYWARPDLNAAAFLSREPLPNFQKRFYRTGDLVRRREDGNLQFLGRKDRQIKVRGYRVELDEVENVLGALREVSEAAVVAIARGEGEKEIVGAVSATPGVDCDVAQVRQKIAELLPPYAIPQRIELLVQFPRTGSGKIDRRALAERLEQNRSD